MSQVQENRITKILYNQVSLCVGAVALISSFIFWVTNPQNEMVLDIVKLQSQVENNQTVAVELEKIKNNDLHEIQLRMDRIEERQIEELQAIARLESLLQNKQ